MPRGFLTAVATLAVVGSALLVAGISAAAVETSRSITVIPASGTPITNVTEGNAVSPTDNDPGVLVGKFQDSGVLGPSELFVCPSANYTAAIHWGDGKSSNGTVSCENPTAGVPVTFDVRGDHTYVDSATPASATFTISLTVTLNTTTVTGTGNTDTAAIKDAALEVDFDNGPDGPFVAAEGTAVAISVNFFDNNNTFQNTEGPAFDSGITATVDWGDGTAKQSVAPAAPPSNCECAGDFVVAASHAYDAPKTSGSSYTITVTATDDGGQTTSDTFTAKISDAALTAGTPAKSFTATATHPATATVASFSDAAGTHAAAADFAASINWGDNSTSTGTVSAGSAAGSFNVSGTHTYAAAGTKSLTITVTDEEGKTVTMTATATVSPVVLPSTGGQPVAPGWPLLFIALISLGATLLSIGLVRGRNARA